MRFSSDAFGHLFTGCLDFLKFNLPSAWKLRLLDELLSQGRIAMTISPKVTASIRSSCRKRWRTITPSAPSEIVSLSQRSFISNQSIVDQATGGFTS